MEELGTGEEGDVSVSVAACGWENLKAYVLSSAEQDGHDQRMGKSDLEAVDQAISCALKNGEVVMVSRVVEDGL
jgi:hypothetical protein